MNFSFYFINRPIFAAVVSIFIMLAGLAAVYNLPVGQYPEIAPPVVSVQAVYPGASAEVLEKTVAATLESQISGVEDMMYMSSTSGSNGALEIQVTFEIGADLEQAAAEVNNRVKQIEARLPLEVRRQGVTVTKGSQAFLFVVAFTSPGGQISDLEISNYITRNLLDRVKRIPGTTNVQIFGAKDYAMRIWLNPQKMSQLGITVNEVIHAINTQNTQFAPGKIGQPPIAHDQQLVYTISSQGRLTTSEEFDHILIRSDKDGAAVYLKDIARTELGSKNYDFIGRVNGQPATLMGIFLKPGANGLQVAQEVKANLQKFSHEFPPGLSYSIPYDTTLFMKASIYEVIKTLVEAVVLVFFVVLIFLQNLRATLIPMVVIPVSLVGTFAGLYVLGYSINTLTLFGMVLSIGIVVDDAIVVLENTERLIYEKNMTPQAAAIEAIREVSGPVIAIMLVLVAVFVPISFLGGLAGELYRQFSVTISIAVVISGLVALSLTPALCATLLTSSTPKHAIFHHFNHFFGNLTRRYTNNVGWLLQHHHLGLVLFAGLLIVTVKLWTVTPTSLVPGEDQGYYISAVVLPDGASLSRTDRMVSEVTKAMLSNPGNQYSVAFTGMDFLGNTYKNSAATIFASHRPWDERKMPSTALVGELFQKTAHLSDGVVLAFSPPAIMGLGNSGGFELYIQNRGEGGILALRQVVDSFIRQASKDPTFAYVQTLWRPQTPQLRLNIDHARALALGVNLDEVFTTLNATMGMLYINDFNKYGRTWQVLLSADQQYRQNPQDIARLYVKSTRQQMVPLSAFTEVKYSTGPDTLSRFDNTPAVKIFGSARPGISSGQALARVEAIIQESLPKDFSFAWSGASYQEKKTGRTAMLALSMAVLMVFLILAALYNRWTLPLAVILALPFGLFGALLILWIRNLFFAVVLPGVPVPPLTNDVYFQIGLVTLLGLAAKNAILIVEFAVMQQQESPQTSTLDAILEAARLRFRPILMTSLTFILGVLPLVLSSGAGSGARQSVGTGVMGGMIAATVLAVFFVPLFYQFLNRKTRHAP